MLLTLKRIILLLFFGSVLTGIWHTLKPLPKGLSYESPVLPTDNVSFLSDLTYLKGTEKIREQHIFSEAFQMIDSAQEFVVLDVFLFNDDYVRTLKFDSLAQELTTHLVAAVRERGVKVVLITDEINTFYGAYDNPYLEQLKAADAQVVITDMTKTRDSNPIYSGFYRLGIAPFGVSTARTLTNPFSTDSPKVSIGSTLRMLNFKANHRKLIITEQGVLAASANPHDASSNHSNIAIAVKSTDLVRAALEAEQAVLNFSGSRMDITALMAPAGTPAAKGTYSVQLLTEKRIAEQMLLAIKGAKSGDRIDIGVFYLSHRPLIKELIQAADRGTKIRLVLDANKDAFGREKNGIPNRQTAQELVTNGKGNIEVRWYITHGEQFHSKLMKVTSSDKATLFGGSSNFTRRNFDNLNLEADLMVTGPADAPAFTDVDTWFERIWTNKDAQFTAPLEIYADKSLFKVLIYRIMESTGLSTF